MRDRFLSPSPLHLSPNFYRFRCLSTFFDTFGGLLFQLNIYWKLWWETDIQALHLSPNFPPFRCLIRSEPAASIPNPTCLKPQIAFVAMDLPSSDNVNGETGGVCFGAKKTGGSIRGGQWSLGGAWSVITHSLFFFFSPRHALRTTSIFLPHHISMMFYTSWAEHIVTREIPKNVCPKFQHKYKRWAKSNTSQVDILSNWCCVWPGAISTSTYTFPPLFVQFCPHPTGA